MTKINLIKSEIEKFIKLSLYVGITNENVSYFPYSEFVLLEINKGFGKFTLTSGGCFIIYNFLYSDSKVSHCLLFPYLDLKNYISSKKHENIVITDFQNEIVISDGRDVFTYEKVYEDLDKKELKYKFENYPKIPNYKNLEVKRFDKQFLDCITISKKFIKPENKDRLIPALNHTLIKDNNIIASDAHISFHYKTNNENPFMFFSKVEMDLFDNFDYIDYCCNEGWNIIKHKTIIYGKRLEEGVQPVLFDQLKHYISILDKSSFFKIKKEDLLGYCEYIKPFIKDATVNSYLEVVENGLKLYYNNSPKPPNRTINAEIIGYKVGYKICFVQSNIYKVLDSLHSDTINISECLNENGDRNFIGFWLDENPSFHSICSKGFEG